MNNILKNLTRLSVTLLSIIYLAQPGIAAAESIDKKWAETIVTKWNDAALKAIRATHPGPTVVARALAITHTCMFDAWAAYDVKAIGTRFAGGLRRPVNEHTDVNRAQAMSFAARKCLADLFPGEVEHFNALMSDLNYDPANESTDPKTPAGIGNIAAAAVLKFRHQDGANQLGDLNPGAYTDYTGYKPVIDDPNHWQPLQIEGKPLQKFTTPHWGKVVPYALKSGKQFRNSLPTPADYDTDPERYELQAKQVLDYTAHLSDEKKVIAEYWADGPASELPPGHWTLFAEYVSDRDNHSLNDDVKMFFALTNAMFDASIVTWDAKRHFDYVRPVSAINFLYAGKEVESWNGLIDGADWKPYQAASVVTPPFPEYCSGHSTYSAAGAETLKLFTKNDNFGYSVTIKKGTSLVEPNQVPANDTTLYWATFTDAADEAGMSRRYGGIHFVDGDLAGRKIGRLVAQQAWDKSLNYFNGKAVHPPLRQIVEHFKSK